MMMSTSPGGGGGDYNSSGSSAQTISVSGSDEQQQIMTTTSDLRQRKRKVSNRESARRSRMRKQSHLDGLIAQVSQLSKDNAFVLTNLNVTKQMCINVEGENSVLRAQTAELTHRLNSLNEIIVYLNQIHSHGNAVPVIDQSDIQIMMMMKMNGDDDLFNPWNPVCLNYQGVCAGKMDIMY